MRGQVRGLELGNSIAKSSEVDAVQEALTASEENRRDGNVELVD